MATEAQCPEDVAPARPSAGVYSAAGGRPGALKYALALLAFALLWLILINQLRVEWTVNPQYWYGWVVPFLCLGLFLRKAQGFQEIRKESVENSRVNQFQLSALAISAIGFAAFLILPLRLVLEANPNWPTPQWLLACIVIALTLVPVWLALGRRGVRQFAFPVCFILVAVAWPPSIENLLIQGLTRADVAAATECLSWLGIPTVQHGNLIEISTGMVGVNDACSGIRSFQSSIMISLFLGEFYLLNLSRRLLLLPAGFIAAFVFNVCRTSLLVAVASKEGTVAIEKWHDPAGVTITIACTFALWGLAWLLFKKQKAERGRVKRGAPRDGCEKSGAEAPEANLLKSDAALRPQSVRLNRVAPRALRDRPPSSVSRGPVVRSQWSIARPPSSLLRLSLALFVWLVTVEAGVELWYWSHETRPAGGPEWTLNWPPNSPGFTERALPAITSDMLKYDEGHSGGWVSEDHLEWFMYAFKWLPGKIAASSASSHSPDVCLTAAGKVLRPIEDNRCPIEVGGIVLPFRRFEFEESGQVLHVFYCLWEEAGPGRAFAQDSISRIKDVRVRNVLEGRRNLGQRSIEIMVSGAADAKAAREAVAGQLQKLIKVHG